MASTEDQTKPVAPAAPKQPKQHQVEIPKGQHDILATLLNQKSELERQIAAVFHTTIASVKHKVPEGAQFVGTGTGQKLGRTKHFLLFLS